MAPGPIAVTLDRPSFFGCHVCRPGLQGFRRRRSSPGPETTRSKYGPASKAAAGRSKRNLLHGASSVRRVTTCWRSSLCSAHRTGRSRYSAILPDPAAKGCLGWSSSPSGPSANVQPAASATLNSGADDANPAPEMRNLSHSALDCGAYAGPQLMTPCIGRWRVLRASSTSDRFTARPGIIYFGRMTVPFPGHKDQ